MKKVVVLIYIVLFQPIICFADIDYNFYGIVKATALYSNRPLSSFAYLNSSAPTSAGETTGVVGVNSNEDIWTMQVAQSRVGVDLIQEDIFGNLEFDFINFAQSSPTTESRPRLRRAFVGIAINNNNKLQIGQDWDTFSVQ